MPIPYYLLLYTTVPDYLTQRQPHRAAHFAHLQSAIDRGELLLAGAYADPADGAALVFRAERSAVEHFARTDPYVRHGLIEQWTVRVWTVVAGTLMAADG